MAISSDLTNAETERLAARVGELEHERKHLLAVIEILKEVSTSLHFTDILQVIARKLGETFGLDRCSIFLAERGGKRSGSSRPTRIPRSATTSWIWSATRSSSVRCRGARRCSFPTPRTTRV